MKQSGNGRDKSAHALEKYTELSFDGVLLPGGGDIASHRYGALDTHSSVYDVDDPQDAFDLELTVVTVRVLTSLAVCTWCPVRHSGLSGVCVGFRSSGRDRGHPDGRGRQVYILSSRQSEEARWSWT